MIIQRDTGKFFHGRNALPPRFENHAENVFEFFSLRTLCGRQYRKVGTERLCWVLYRTADIHFKTSLNIRKFRDLFPHPEFSSLSFSLSFYYYCLILNYLEVLFFPCFYLTVDLRSIWRESFYVNLFLVKIIKMSGGGSECEIVKLAKWVLGWNKEKLYRILSWYKEWK